MINIFDEQITGKSQTRYMVSVQETGNQTGKIVTRFPIGQ
jgi:hypothetical protein